MEDTEKTLISLLEKQGQDFLAQFPTFYPYGNPTKSGSELEIEEYSNSNDASDIEEEEWLGFSDASSSCDATPEGNQGKGPEVVIFDDASSKITPIQHKESFMSSKISKLKDLRHKADLGEDEEPGEESNIRNDALLHRLIHTELLSESLKNGLTATSTAQRHKALAGRVLELSGDAKLGKGETLVRKEEKNRASKSVREGLLTKEKRRREKALAEAKESGNYHRSLRKIYHADEKVDRRKRDRGLSMGVGHFKGGILKLSRHEIKSVDGIKPTPNFKKRKF